MSFVVYLEYFRSVLYILKNIYSFLVLYCMRWDLEKFQASQSMRSPV